MAEATQEQPKWYAMPPEAVAQQLKVDPAKGLSAAEAQQRLQQYGRNELAAKMKLSTGVAELQPWQKNTLSYSTEGKLLSAGGAKVDLDPILLPMALEVAA